MFVWVTFNAFHYANQENLCLYWFIDKKIGVKTYYFFFQYGLRQLDLSLLSQLWTLNESIQEFRSILQEQEALSPPSPTSSNSQSESELPSSEDEEPSSGQLLSHHHHASVSTTPQHYPTAASAIVTAHSKSSTQAMVGHSQVVARMRIPPPGVPKRNPPSYQSRPV